MPSRPPAARAAAMPASAGASRAAARSPGRAAARPRAGRRGSAGRRTSRRRAWPIRPRSRRRCTPARTGARRRGGRASRAPFANISAEIRLHTPVLPGIDDGPGDLAASVAVAEIAAHGGVRTLVATPHLRADHPGVRPGELAERARELSAHLRERRRAGGARALPPPRRERGLPVEVLPGAEVDLDAAAALPDAELRLATLGGNG